VVRSAVLQRGGHAACHRHALRLVTGRAEQPRESTHVRRSPIRWAADLGGATKVAPPRSGPSSIVRPALPAWSRASPTGAHRSSRPSQRRAHSVKILVTGGAGFIGHHLVRGLLARGDEVTVIDDLSTGFRSRLDPVLGNIRLVEGSILDQEALDRAVAGNEVILHEAAIPSVARSLVKPELSNSVNAGGTIQVMLAAARHGVRRVVYAGSSSVYGIPAELPCRETMKPDPRSPYGVSKIAAE